MEEKDLVHIVKVSDDTFAQFEIIPIFGIISNVCLVLSLIFKTIVHYVVKISQ